MSAIVPDYGNFGSGVGIIPEYNNAPITGGLGIDISNYLITNKGVIDISAGSGITISGSKDTSLVINATSSTLDISAGSNIVVTDVGGATVIDLSSTVTVTGSVNANSIGTGAITCTSINNSGVLTLNEGPNSYLTLGAVGIGNVIQGQNQGGIGSIYHYTDNAHTFFTKNSLGMPNAVLAVVGGSGNPGILVNGDQPGAPRGIVNCGSVTIDKDIYKTEDGGISFQSILKALPLMFGRQAAGGQNNLYYPESYTGKGVYVNSSKSWGFIDSIWLAPHVHFTTYSSTDGGGTVQNDFHNTNDNWSSFGVGGVGYNSYTLYFET